MLSVVKRYGMAIIFLLLVTILMLLGTLGVKNFGDNMFEEIENADMKPRGEKVKL